MLVWVWANPNGTVIFIKAYASMDDWCNDSDSKFLVPGLGDRRLAGESLVGWNLSSRFINETQTGLTRTWFFHRLQFIFYMHGDGGMIHQLDAVSDITIQTTTGVNETLGGVVSWNPTWNGSGSNNDPQWWANIGNPIVGLVHELGHAYIDLIEAKNHPDAADQENSEPFCIRLENLMHYALYGKAWYTGLYPRPGWDETNPLNCDLGDTPAKAWAKYWGPPGWVVQYP